jgi:predicted membrane protein
MLWHAIKMMQAIRGVTFATFIGFDWRRTVLQTVFVKDISIVILSVLALIFHLRIELAYSNILRQFASYLLLR